MNIILNEDFDYEIEEDEESGEQSTYIDIDNSRDEDFIPDDADETDDTIPEIEIDDENEDDSDSHDPDDDIDPNELRAVYVLKNDKYVLKDMIKEKEKHQKKLSNNIPKTRAEKKQFQKQEFDFKNGRKNEPNKFKFEQVVGPKMLGTRPITIFRNFFDDTLVKYIVDRSNAHAERPKVIIPRPKRRKTEPIIEKTSVKKKSPQKIEKEKITDVEFLRFLGIIMLMSIGKKNKITDYWNSNNVVFTPIYKKYFKISRFIKIMSDLNFQQPIEDYIEDKLKYQNKTDDLVQTLRNTYYLDSIHKIRWVIDYLKLKMRSLYTPEQHLSVDESLFPMKHRNVKPPLKQSIRSKRAKTGIKIYKVCEATTGYCYNFLIESNYNMSKCKNKVIRTVIELLSCQESGCYIGSLLNTPEYSLLNKGYIVYTDRGFTSLDLTKLLLDNKTHIVGTCPNDSRFDTNLVDEVLCKSKPNNRFPMNVEIDESELNKGFLADTTITEGSAPSNPTVYLDYGETIFSSSTKQNILALKFNDNKCLNILSTIHTDDEMVTLLNRDKKIPLCVQDFIKYMRGVDRHDQLLSYNPLHRKTKVYEKKAFLHMVNIVVLNCYIIYKKILDDKKIKTFEDFIIVLGQELCELGSEKGMQTKTPSYSKEHLIIRNINSLNNKPIKLKCVECKKKGIRSEPSWKCQKCLVSLCVGCFAEYHKGLNN
jgi:hypothetical protein